MGTPRTHKPSPRQRTSTTPNEVLTPTDILVSRTQGDTDSRGTAKGGKKPVRVKIVEIHWTDALAVGGEDWVDEEGVHPQGAPSLAVGYVVNETNTTITVISLTNDQHYSHGITIPKGCITKTVPLT